MNKNVDNLDNKTNVIGDVKVKELRLVAQSVKSSKMLPGETGGKNFY